MLLVFVHLLCGNIQGVCICVLYMGVSTRRPNAKRRRFANGREMVAVHRLPENINVDRAQTLQTMRSIAATRFAPEFIHTASLTSDVLQHFSTSTLQYNLNFNNSIKN